MATIAEEQNKKAEEANQADIKAQNETKDSADAITPQSEDFAPLTGFLSVSEPSMQEKDQLKKIWEFASNSSEDKSTASILYAIQKIENRLSAPRLGETRLAKLYHYVALQRQVDQATKMRDAMMRPIMP